MAYQYFSCKWIANIKQQWYLPSVVDAALELHCELGVLGTIQKNVEGYQFIVFMLSVPDRKVLGQFIQKAGQSMGMVSWQAINRDEIATYKSLTQLAQAQQSDALTSFYSGVSVIAGYNRELKRKLEREAIRRRRWWYKAWRMLKRS